MKKEAASSVMWLMACLDAHFTDAQGQECGTRLFLEIQARGHRGSPRSSAPTSPQALADHLDL
ncbi:hypothetical protein ADL07_17755 [Streptomyces sp. NRRL F-4707]|nr:hypothetical protein ADL07_17755 [Streptomyces sp. NRRL F-4707]